MKEEPKRPSTAIDRATAQYERLAKSADEVARTVELSADVHEQMTDHNPRAAERAEDLRRLAAAEREAAAAYRRGETPSEEVQQTIRTRGHVPATDSAASS
ncbi:hypothetical protein AB0F81_09685 [Actinoplanes sp. NPDC024001]|uniref:hypothetical protein n=1 Tax=Actinoplanes sp. NPDC024001 TaxID=3154598 RepID=UPI0034041D85